MKRIELITAAVGVVSALCLIAYFLALHDVFNDYVSVKALQDNLSGAASLPAWTACSLEWRIVGICFWPMLAFHAIFLAGLIRIQKGKKAAS